MKLILGIDPGSRITGFGLVQSDGSKHQYVASGCIRVLKGDLDKRLAQIFNELREVVLMHQPDEAAIEQVFMHANPSSALKLGQARGAAITALTEQNLIFGEYSPRQVKQAVVGYGAATKAQVQHMVKLLLNLSGDIQEDAADALAIAICHAHHSKTVARR